MARDKDYYNAEGYPDPTAYKAIKHDRDSHWRKAKFLIEIFLFMTRECGFKVTTRIELEDQQTGKMIK